MTSPFGPGYVAPVANLIVTIEHRTYRKSVRVPEQYWPEAERRMQSAATPDGQRHCLNRCFLPFYEWVREETQKLYEEKIVEFKLEYPEFAHLDVPPFGERIPAHPHVPGAPHWFQEQLQS